MKKLFAILLSLTMLLSLAACGAKNEDPAPKEEKPTESSQSQQSIPVEEPTEAADEAPQPEPPAELSGFMGTKTGKFYSRFTSGKMYMEYEMEAEGQKMSIISATSGGRIYAETSIDGVSAGISIIDGDTMYVIDHASKIVIKMSLQTDILSAVGTVLEESDVNMGDYVTGSREIDGKVYDTEEWIIEGQATIFCFDSDRLAYIIGSYDGLETAIKIVSISDNVDESLFEIPSDYSIFEM